MFRSLEGFRGLGVSGVGLRGFIGDRVEENKV